MRVTAVLILSALAFAEEPDAGKETRPITVNLENVGPAKAAKMLKKAAGLRVEIAPQLASRRINLRLVGVPTSSAMTSLAEHFRCELRFYGKKRWHLAPKWQFAILDKLAASAPKLSKRPIDEALDAIRKGAGVDITLDREVDRALVVALSAKKKTFRDLLDYVTKKAKLKWELRYGVVYVATKERLKKIPILVPGLKDRRLTGRRLDVTLEAVALDQVGTKLGVGLVPPKGEGARKITARARSITLPQALALILYPHGWTTREAPGGLEIHPLPPR